MSAEQKIFGEEFWRKFWRGLSASARNRGSVAGIIQLLEELKKSFSLNIADFHTQRGSQMKFVSAPRLQGILERHGEKRVLLKVGGRTNRGLLPVAEKFLAVLQNDNFAEMPPKKRLEALDAIQYFAVLEAVAFLNKDKLKINLQAGSTRAIVCELLIQARNRKKEGAVVQYLTGAKLALRFPEIDVENRDASAADDSGETLGDFIINDTVFHVTVAPTEALRAKCESNLAKGRRVWVLVCDDKLQAARQMVENKMVTVESVESFVSQNIDEMSEFSTGKKNKLIELLALYNKRTEMADTDLSLLIEIPQNG